MKIYLVEKRTSEYTNYFTEIIAAKYSKEDAQAIIDRPVEKFVAPTEKEWLELIESGYFGHRPPPYQQWCENCELMWDETNQYSLNLIEMELD